MNRDDICKALLYHSPDGLSKKELNDICLQILERKSYYPAINNQIKLLNIEYIDNNNNILVIREKDTFKPNFEAETLVLDFLNGKNATDIPVTKNPAFASAVAEQITSPPTNTILDEDIITSSVEVKGNFPYKVARSGKEIFMVDSCPSFIDNQNILLKIEVHMRSNLPVMLIGEKGNGKTVVAYNLALVKGIPLIRVQCSQETDEAQLLGYPAPGPDGNFIFTLGRVTTAIDIANETGEAMLLFDEFNALTNGTQKMLNSLMDWRREIDIPRISALFKLKEGCKLHVICTGNPSGYAGTFNFNHEMRSRLSFINVKQLSKSQKQKIIKANVNGVSDDFVRKIVSVSEDLNAAIKSGELSYAPALRDLQNICEINVEYKGMMDYNTKPTEITKLSLGHLIDKYEGGEQDLVMSKINSQFGGIY